MEKEKIIPTEKTTRVSESEIVEIEVIKTQLELLKESYAVLEKEYSLPAFTKMNKDFSIEKINEEETEYLIREIRRYVSEKINGYLRLTETLLHPNNAQMFVFTMIKSISKTENQKLQNIYKQLAAKEIDLIELDLEFNLEKEIKFINDSFSMWQEIKKEFLRLILKIKKDWKNGTKNNSKDRDYFG